MHGVISLFVAAISRWCASDLTLLIYLLHRNQERTFGGGFMGDLPRSGCCSSGAQGLGQRPTPSPIPITLFRRDTSVSWSVTVIIFSDIGMVATPKNSVTLDMESWVQIQRTSTVDLPIVL
ncbi:uncharacterized protein LACBIDRAFT_320618 [Laccaria bicolor S238N-H82]|uniref:Predicted protein n=1 Tax=Laccaria bicolor (strain S238N-H82 / ATCC MYA-4686) TaxID=486041 RepID=B0CQM1_LACBS|nr:uncharacterized protein LACBIDRAFT_320618 [Laccaria bicolor S238N-H82]EDR15670.1 predicted protein [Laccaria bicolor S238N-H82]|eukprot:XP_001873878.1 predicted protein [Laccaria bicolor S238N-H82]